MYTCPLFFMHPSVDGPFSHFRVLAGDNSTAVNTGVQVSFRNRVLSRCMAPHSSALAWKIPWKEEPGGLQSMGSLELDTTERLPFHFSLSCIGEGNGNPLQCSCLENPRDRGARWAAVYGVAQSRTRLKRLSSSSSRFRVGLPDPMDRCVAGYSPWGCRVGFD